MLPNAKLKKKILSEEGEVIGFSEDWYPLKVVVNSNARTESATINEGMKNKQFSTVLTTRTTLLDNYASRIDVGDKIELLFMKTSVIVKYIEQSPKRLGQNITVYYLGVE